jgi:predicted amidohydrolase
MRVAMVSLDQAWEAPGENLAACRAAAARAADLGAELVVFPELTLTGFTMNATPFAEDPRASPTIDAFAKIAADLGVHSAFGVALQGDARPRNTLVVVNRAGEEVARYAKVHPFTWAGEDAAYEGGGELVVACLDDVAYGLAVCYDLRFPGMFAALAPRCDALLVIANWPGRRITHWEALLRARAIEGQCAVLGVNRTGSDGKGIAYPRSSLGFAPDGTPLTPLASDHVIDVVTVDAEAVRACRTSFPVLRDARPDVYSRVNRRGG